MKQESQRRQRSARSSGEIGRVFHRRAEAGRTDHGAVGAAQTAGRHLVPARMLEIAHQQFVEVVRTHFAAHRGCGVFDDSFSGFDLAT